MITRRSKRSAASAEIGSTGDQPNYGEMPRPMESPGTIGSITSDVSETARTAGQAIGDQAMAFVTDVGHELGKKADDQKFRGVEAIRALAGAVDTAAQQFEQQSPQVARYARDAAERARSLSRTIEERSFSELLRSATDVARSKPAIFFAGAVLAGFAFSRLLKSSAEEEVAMSASGRGDGLDRSDDESDTGGIAYGNP
jgi:hypothetical protein